MDLCKTKKKEKKKKFEEDFYTQILNLKCIV